MPSKRKSLTQRHEGTETQREFHQNRFLAVGTSMLSASKNKSFVGAEYIPPASKNLSSVGTCNGISANTNTREAAND
jgi:hypothetical protein